MGFFDLEMAIFDCRQTAGRQAKRRWKIGRWKSTSLSLALAATSPRSFKAQGNYLSFADYGDIAASMVGRALRRSAGEPSG